MGTTTDIRLAIDGDRGGLERLFESVGPGLQSFLRWKLRGLSGVDEAIDHLTAEVWMAARAAIPERGAWMTTADRRRVLYWFRRVAQNRCTAYLAERARRGHPDLGTEVTAEARSVVSQAGESEVWSAVRDALDRIPERDRTLLRMRFFDGFSSSEIGARLGISPEAARQRLRRSLGRLEADLPTAVKACYGR